MRDTPAEVEARFRALLLERSGEARLRMAGSMYAAARALVVASILDVAPEASAAEVRRQLFLRFYGHEFEAACRERIAGRVAGAVPAPDRSPEEV